MSGSGWLIRSGQPDDRDLLSSFACANPTVAFEVEAQNFIRTQLIDWTFDPLASSGDPRLLLAVVAATGELFGVAAHEKQTLQGGDGAEFNATKLEVVGIAASWQGRRFQTGERASDVVMSAIMTDVSARVPRRDAPIFAVVHQDVRSIAVCRRHGLTEEMSRADPSYRRLVTPYRQQGDSERSLADSSEN